MNFSYSEEQFGEVNWFLSGGSLGISPPSFATKADPIIQCYVHDTSYFTPLLSLFFILFAMSPFHSLFQFGSFFLSPTLCLGRLKFSYRHVCRPSLCLEQVKRTRLLSWCFGGEEVLPKASLLCNLQERGRIRKNRITRR